MEENKQIEFLKDKSIEAFLLSIEVFNKSTIRYRLEGCVYLLCNAWELLLKAKLLMENKQIFFADKPNRTFSLQDCIKEVFTNEKDPIRQNLSVIISLRNTSTHFVLPEYEFAYIPFLSFCVKAYTDKLYEFVNIRITDYIKTDFLSLFVPNLQPNKTEMISKYGINLFDLFEKRKTELQSYFDCEEGASIAYNVTINFARINNKSKADIMFYSSNNLKDQNVMYIDRPVDANKTHAYTHHQIAKEIDKIIKREGINFTPIKVPIPTEKHPTPPIFTTACLDALIKRFDLKNNSDYVIKIETGKSSIYKYSKNLIDWVIAKIMEDSEIVIKSR